jgi:hypothetical protein
MVVALDTTLRALNIATLVRRGQVGWQRIEDARVNGADIFIGAGVTRYDETFPDIDLCAEIEALFGFVLGLNTNLANLPVEGAWFNDFDEPFADNAWVRVGIPQQGGVYLILSATNETIAIGDKLMCVDGVFAVAMTADNYQMIAEQAVVGAANTRRYLYARWVKN